MGGLAVVGLESGELAVEMLGGVDEVVRSRGAEDPHLRHCPVGESFILEQARVREWIACIGVDREDRGLAGGEVVGVRAVDTVPVAIGGLDEHSLRTHLADDPADVATQFMGDGEFAIGVPEEANVMDAEDLAGRALLGSADSGDLRARNVVVGAARIAIGDDAVRDGDAGGCCCGDCSAGAEVNVVGVGRHDEDPLDLGIVQHVLPHGPG